MYIVAMVTATNFACFRRSIEVMRQSQILLNTPGSADRCTLRVQTGFAHLPNHYANYRKPTSSVLVCDEARAGLIPFIGLFLSGSRIIEINNGI